MSRMSRAGEALMAIYQAAYARFGHQQWWPGDTALEMCVGAVLTQNTSWKNVEKALANLKAAGHLSLAALHALSQEELAGLIRPAGYYNIKARRLKNFIAHVAESGNRAARSVPSGQAAGNRGKATGNRKQETGKERTAGSGKGESAIENRKSKIEYPTKPDGTPDFAKMTPAQRLAYHQARLDGMFG